MVMKKVPTGTSRPVKTVQTDNITSTTDAGIIGLVPRGSGCKAVLVTSGGTAGSTATVYSTLTPLAAKPGDVDDNTHAEITGSTNRPWDAWGAGAVTANTVQQLNIPLSAVALTVAAGTWRLEVTVDGQ